MRAWSEKDLLIPALALISTHNKGLNTKELIELLTETLKPEGDDLLSYKGRNDTVFSQKVRNLISHASLLKYVYTNEGRMFINEYGYAFLRYPRNDKECSFPSEPIIDISDEKATEIIEHQVDLENTNEIADEGSIEDGHYSLNIETNDDFRDENTGTILPKKSIELDNMYLSVSDLKRRFDRLKAGRTDDGLILDPAYQRGNEIWRAASKSLFIESIILNIPIPSIYLSEDKNGNLVVIDGRQRLTTLFDFIDGKFKLSGLILLEELNGKRFNDLKDDYSKYRAKIEDRSLHIAKIRFGTDEMFIIETFGRVNTKGASLNAQEIRNALHQGKSTNLLNEISAHYCGGNEIIDKKRMKDKYLILRYFAMNRMYRSFVNKQPIIFKSITEYLGQTMDVINGYSAAQINSIKDDFIAAYERAINVFGPSNAFRLKPGLPINMILFEITILFASLLKDCNDSTFKNSLEMFLKSDIDNQRNAETPFEQNIKYHRDSQDNIEQRLLWIERIVTTLSI